MLNAKADGEELQYRRHALVQGTERCRARRAQARHHMRCAIFDRGQGDASMAPVVDQKIRHRLFEADSPPVPCLLTACLKPRSAESADMRLAENMIFFRARADQIHV